MGRASFFGGKVFQLSVVKMLFLQTVSFTFSLLLINIGEREGLMAQGNSNLTDGVHGSTGHGPNVNVDIAEMMQILMNQTAEIENLKQQTAEIEKMKQQAAEIESLRELTCNLTQQSENDRSTIQILQNKLFSLEAELDRLNTSKPTSTQELSSYLSGMNHLIQTMVTKEANDKNLTHLLNVTVKNFEDQNVQVQYTSLSLIDVHIMPEMNGSLNKQLEDKINGYIHDQIANLSRKVAFTASVSSSSSSWSTSTLVFPVVITNLGHGYNLNDGVFTAPTAGVYVFFVNVQSYNSLSVYVDIVVNGARKVRAMASNHYDAGPNLAVLTLLKEDRVWVKRYSGQGYYSNGPMTTFSGFLIG